MVISLRHKATGEVVGEILNEKGEVVASRSFGVMTEDEFENINRRIGQEFTDSCSGRLIDMVWN